MEKMKIGNLLQIISIDNCMNKDLWEKLNEFLLTKKMACMLQHQDSFQNTKKGTSSITDFYHSLQNLADALYDVDSPITEIELVIQILRQLPTSYHNIVDVIIVFQPTPQHASLTLTAYEAILGPTTFT